MSTPSPQDRMNEVLNAAIEMTAAHLKDQGGFIPYAFFIDGDTMATIGTRALIEDGAAEDLSSDEIIAESRELLSKAVSDRPVATSALVTDTTVTNRESGEQFDAIVIELEDSEHGPLLCVIPYRIGGQGVGLGEASFQRCERTWSG